MSEPHLVAHVMNAKSAEDAEVVYDIAFLNPQGEWETNFGELVLPFWYHPLDLMIDWEMARIHGREKPVTFPDGWIDHIHAVAQSQAAAKRDAMRPSGLAALLAAKRPAPAPSIPLNRRGF